MQLRLRPTAGSGRQRRVIQLRFGLLDGHMRALEEVARRLGTSRETVRQLEHEALVAGGVLGQLFAWIAAVINTAKLEEKTWVLGLVVLGLLSFGFAALVAYMIGAPDESEDAHRRGALPDRRLPGLAS
jgi:Sigma-70, region 4